MREAVRSVTSPWTLLLVVVLCGYAFYYRATMPTTGVPLGQLEVSALFATDPYYLFYAVLPAWFICALRTIRDDLAVGVLGRSRTTVRWLRVSLTALGVRLWPLGVLLVLVWAIAGLGYVPSWGWLRLPLMPEESIFSPGIAPGGLSPVALIAVQLGVLVVAGSTSYILLATTAVLTGRMAPAVILAVFLVLASIGSHSLPHPGLLQFGALENYLSPLGSQIAFGSWWAASALLLPFCGALLALLRRRDRQVAESAPTGRRATVIGVAIVAVLVALSAVLSGSSSRSMSAATREVFQGAGVDGGGNLLSLMFAAAVFLLPSFLYALRLEDEFGGNLLYVLIRSHSFGRFLLTELIRHAAFIVVYLLGVGTLFTSAWFLARTASSSPADGSSDLAMTSYQFLVNGLLQLLFYWALTLLLVTASGRARSAVIGLAATIVVAVIGIRPIAAWAPVFANSLSHLTFGWAGLVQASCILIGATALCVGLSVVLVNRRGVAVA